MNNKYSFEKGLGEIKVSRKKFVKEKLFQILQLKPNSRSAYHKYRKGDPKLPIAKYEAITELFRSEGVENPWGSTSD